MHQTSFGSVIAAAREDLGYTQLDTIARINQILSQGNRKIGVSYLSKLENHQLGPPSDPVIIALAKTLKLNQDDLLAAAGRAPTDIGGLLMKSKGARRFFRSAVKRSISENRWEQLRVLIEGPDHIADGVPPASRVRA